MTIIKPEPISTLPTPPAKGEAGFNAKCETFFGALVESFTPQLNNAIAATNANALSAEQSSLSAQAAAAGISVNLWVNNRDYVAGESVKSPAALAAGASNPIYICKASTNGTRIDPYLDSAHWSIFLISNSTGGAVYTTSTTLTSSSPFAISISGGAGVWLKLPDATTLSTGIRHTVRNVGENDLTLIDASGAHIGFIRPQCGTTIALSNNSTAAGKWVGDWELYGITTDLSLGLSISSSNIFTSAVKIDNNTTMFLYGQVGGGLYAVVYDTSTQLPTGNLLIRVAFNHCAAVLIGGNVAVLTCDSSTALQVALISPTCTMLSIASGAASGTVNSIGQFTVFGSGLVASYSTSAPTGIIRGISVSGTTLAFGSEVSVAAQEAPRLYINGNYLMAVRHNNSNAIYCTPYTLFGNTLTAGASANTPAESYNISLYRTDQLDNGDIIAMHVYASNLVLNVFKLSGSTCSVYSANVFPWANTTYYYIDNFAHIKLSNNRIAIGGQSATAWTQISVVIATNNSATPTISQPYNLSAPGEAYLKPTSSGFATNGVNNSFDFSGGDPVFNGVTKFSASFFTQYGYGSFFNKMSYFGKNIIKSQSGIIFAILGDLQGKNTGVILLSGKSSIDNPHKIKMAITQNPNFYGESKSSCIAAYSIAYEMGFRIVRVKCID